MYQRFKIQDVFTEYVFFLPNCNLSIQYAKGAMSKNKGYYSEQTHSIGENNETDKKNITPHIVFHFLRKALGALKFLMLHNVV